MIQKAVSLSKQYNECYPIAITEYTVALQGPLGGVLRFFRLIDLYPLYFFDKWLLMMKNSTKKIS